MTPHEKHVRAHHLIACYQHAIESLSSGEVIVADELPKAHQEANAASIDEAVSVLRQLVAVQEQVLSKIKLVEELRMNEETLEALRALNHNIGVLVSGMHVVDIKIETMMRVIDKLSPGPIDWNEEMRKVHQEALDEAAAAEEKPVLRLVKNDDGDEPRVYSAGE